MPKTDTDVITIPEVAKREDVVIEFVLTKGQAEVVFYADIDSQFDFKHRRPSIKVTYANIAILESELNAWLAKTQWTGRGDKTCVNSLLKQAKTQLDQEFTRLNAQREQFISGIRKSIARDIHVDSFVKKLEVDSCDNRGMLRVACFDTTKSNFGSQYEMSSRCVEIAVYIRPADNMKDVVTTYYVDDTFCKTDGYATLDEALNAAYAKLDDYIARTVTSYNDYVAKCIVALNEAGLSLVDEKVSAN